GGGDGGSSGVGGAGEVRVEAGPGSGKTRTLVARVVELVEGRGVKPEHVTVVTFTRKAADELVSRLRTALGPRAAERVAAGTFHSLSARLLRTHFHHFRSHSAPNSRLASLPRDFRVLEEEERSRLLLEAVRWAEAGWGLPHDHTRVKRVRELVSYLKNRSETTAGLSRPALLALLRQLGRQHPQLG
ncbi:hypothetical protein Agub_g9018, partial [Astrephomene gubernaculifera]